MLNSSNIYAKGSLTFIKLRPGAILLTQMVLVSIVNYTCFFRIIFLINDILDILLLSIFYFYQLCFTLKHIESFRVKQIVNWGCPDCTIVLILKLLNLCRNGGKNSHLVSLKKTNRDNRDIVVFLCFFPLYQKLFHLKDLFYRVCYL